MRRAEDAPSSPPGFARLSGEVRSVCSLRPPAPAPSPGRSDASPAQVLVRCSWSSFVGGVLVVGGWAGSLSVSSSSPTLGRGTDAFVAGVLAVVGAGAGAGLARALRGFARRERVGAVGRLVGVLEGVATDTRTLNQPGCTSVPVFRDGQWTWMPENLLVTGDVVALAADRRTPAKVQRLDAPFEVMERDAPVTATEGQLHSQWLRDHLAATSPSSSRETGYAEHTVGIGSLNFFRVLDSPLVHDVSLFLRRAEEDQRTTMGYNLDLVSRVMAWASVVAFLVFLVLGCIRYWVPRANDVYPLPWPYLVFVRPATLLFLVSPLTHPVFRFFLDVVYMQRLLGVHRHVDAPSFMDVLRRWCGFARFTEEKNVNMPLCPSAVVGTLGTVTALCGMDEDCLLSPTPGVEEVFLLKGEDKFAVVDCCNDPTSPYGVRFEDPNWRQHMNSLKPVGLACALGATRVPPMPMPPTNATTLASLLQFRMHPGGIRNWAWTMGFREADVLGFVPKRHWIVVDPTTHVSKREVSNHARKNVASWSTFHDRPCMDCVVFDAPQHHTPNSNSSATTVPPPAGVAVAPPGPSLTPEPLVPHHPGTSSTPVPPPPLLTSQISVTSASSSTAAGGTSSTTTIPVLQSAVFMAWGHTSFMLNFCSDYWDGECIWPLGENTRTLVRDMSERWAKEGFDSVAFSYAPLVFHHHHHHHHHHGAAAAATPPPPPTAVAPGSSLGGGAQPPPPIPSPCEPPTHIMASSPLVSPDPVVVMYPSPPASSSASPPAAIVDEYGLNLLATTLSRDANIFTGMLGSRDQPLPDVVSLAGDAHKAGIRFVYFSPRDAPGARMIAAQMGLETDWNTSISLRDAPPQAQAVTAAATGPRPAHMPPPPTTSTLALELGLVDWELKARMPRGVDAIRHHLAHVDDVPLRVSVFTDSAPSEVCGMIQIMRDHGERVCAFGSAPARGTTLADVAIEVRDDVATLNPVEAISRDFGALACSMSVSKSASRLVILDLLGDARIVYFSFRQANVMFLAFCGVVALAQMVVFCLTTPDMFTPCHCLWLVWVQAPLTSLPVAFRPRSRNKLLRERMPWKQSASHADAAFYARFLVYGVVRLVPVSLCVVVWFCWGLGEWEAIGWGGTTSATLGSSSSSGNTTAGAGVWSLSTVMAAQSITLLGVTWSMCVVCATLASRVDWHMEPGFWRLWAGVSALAVSAQVVYNCAYSSAATGSCVVAFEGVSLAEWLVVLLLPPVLFPLLAVPTKAHDRRVFRHAMMLLRLDFETKLGQFSPR